MKVFKQGDTHDVAFPIKADGVVADLTGLTVNLTRRLKGSITKVPWGNTIPNPLNGKVVATLPGNLVPGIYYVKAELVGADGKIASAPSEDFAKFRIEADEDTP